MKFLNILTKIKTATTGLVASIFVITCLYSSNSFAYNYNNWNNSAAIISTVIGVAAAIGVASAISNNYRNNYYYGGYGPYYNNVYPGGGYRYYAPGVNYQGVRGPAFYPRYNYYRRW